MIVITDCETDGALHSTRSDHYHLARVGGIPMLNTAMTVLRQCLVRGGGGGGPIHNVRYVMSGQCPARPWSSELR